MYICVFYGFISQLLSLISQLNDFPLDDFSQLSTINFQLSTLTLPPSFPLLSSDAHRMLIGCSSDAHRMLRMT